MKPVCPNPSVWHETVMRLERLARARGIVEPVPTPLILGGWAYSNDVQKKGRWEETVAWARKYNLTQELPVDETDFYKVDELFAGTVGPTGGPMKLPWRFDPATKPDPDVLAEALSKLQGAWESLCPSDVVAVTRPSKFTGKKGRRLEVRVLDRAAEPPWGTWTELSRGAERRLFTELRAAINRCIAPHAVDHVDFILP